MKITTEDQRQALITALEILKPDVKKVGIPALLSTVEIALSSLIAEPVGIVNRGRVSDDNEYPDAKVDCTHPQAGWENFQDGFQLYAAPPITTLKFPDKNELPGWARNWEDSLDWYETEIRRLNGMSE